MMFNMKAILVQLDPFTARMLEKVAPGRGRKRSRFIREAIVKALMDVAEEHTRRAYMKHEQEPVWFDPACWAPESEAIHPPKRRRRKRR
jgi:hypothetical protein